MRRIRLPVTSVVILALILQGAGRSNPERLSGRLANLLPRSFCFERRLYGVYLLVSVTCWIGRKR